MSDQESNRFPLAKSLTQREQDVLTLIGDGFTNREIGDHLVIAHSTVKWYVRQIYNKLGVQERKEAITRARQLNLLEPPDRRPLNLPRQSTVFVGRKSEVAQLIKMLAAPNNRMVTILGPGGMGKTRLAIEVARNSARSFPDGVFFIPLDSLDDPLSIVPEIANALSFTFYVRDQSEHWEYDTEQAQLLAYLGDKQLLLILDNTEHLLTSAIPSLEDWKRGIEQIAAEIMRKAPSVRILATSRQRLNLKGETVFPVSGLQIPTRRRGPDVDSTNSLQELAQFDAVQLFVDNAARVRPGFSLDEDNVGTVVEICNLTEGMPLGIELAAAWMAMLSPVEIAEEIGRNLEFLATDAKDLPNRHRSMRAVFESTWHRLSDNERSAFQRLSIFRGGFTREAAQNVTDVSLSVLMALVNKSIIRPNFKGRYQMHELLRQFGAERLALQPRLEEELRNQHCSFFAAFLRQKEPYLSGPNQRRVLAEIKTELNNVRLAWKWAVKHMKLAELEQAMESLCEFFRFRGLLDEGFDAFYPASLTLGWEGFRSPEELPDRRGMFQETLHLLALDTANTKNDDHEHRVLGKVLARYDRFYCESPERAWKACQVRQDTLRILQDSGEREEMAWLLRYLGHVWYSPEEQQAIYQKALAIFREVGDEQGIADSLYRLGMGAISAGNYRHAANYLQDSLELAGSIQRQEIVLSCLLESGYLDWILGDFQIAESRIKEAQLINKDFGYASQNGRAQRVLSRLALSRGDYHQAEQLLRASLAIYEKLGLQGLRAETLADLAEVASLTDDINLARELAQGSLAICEELDHHVGRSLPLIVLGEVALADDEIEKAKRQFHRAVKNATDTWMPAYALHALEATARLMAAQGANSHYLGITVYLLNHPASWRWTKDRLLTHLNALHEETTPESFMDEHGNWVGESITSVIEKIFGGSSGT